MNETIVMRAAVSAAVGVAAFAIGGIGALAVKAVKQEVGVAVPLAAAISAAVTVYAIDTLTERRSKTA